MDGEEYEQYMKDQELLLSSGPTNSVTTAEQFNNFIGEEPFCEKSILHYDVYIGILFSTALSSFYSQ